jgi:hypothetical protein
MIRALVLASLVSLTIPAWAQHAHHAEPGDDRANKADPRLAEGQIAPVLEGLGEHHHKITTKSERAQQFFDQGLKLAYGFNHREALRAFKEAARLDPDCAMAYWGWAFVLGPNINLPMQKDAVPQAWEALEMARARRDKASETERAYIDALSRRYAKDPEAERGPLDRAYADAMRELSRRYAEDTDAATLFADALMNVSPWNYWTPDKKPRENTLELLATLEGALSRDPTHEGALHYYIHAIEAVDAARGVEAADRLRPLAPGAGHLLHMPSHLYIQLGRYADAFEANALAARSDESYITQCRAQGIYPLNYFPHNVHFLAWAAFYQGRGQEALAASKQVRAGVPQDMSGNDWGLFESFLSMPLYTMVRFGMWNAILAEPEPRKELRLSTGVWHYARGRAYAATNRAAEAKRELARVEALASDPKSADALVGYANAARLLEIARYVLAGEIASAEKRHDDAVTHLDRATRLEDSLHYNEPPDWYYPVRHSLGAALLEAQRPVEAEVVYWQDLRKYPENGYALYGLWRAYEAQGKKDEAAEYEARYKTAWSAADAPLKSSRY